MSRKKGSRRRIHVPRKGQLGLESLERRLPLDGNVSVVFSGGSVRIEGDALGNEVTMMVDAAGNLALSGQNNTTINGTSGPLIIGTASDRVHGSLDIQMGAGDDVVNLGGFFVSEMLRVFGGEGADQIQLTNTESRKLHVRGNAGDDVLQVEDVRTTKWTTLRLDDGDDVLSVNGLTAGRNISVMGDGGDDAIATTGMTAGKKLYFSTDAGSDQAVLFGQTQVSKRADVGTGAGDDFFAILPGRTDDDARFGRRLKVWLGQGADAFATDSAVTARRLRVDGAQQTDIFDSGGASLGRQRIKNVEARSLGDLEARVDALFARLGDVGVDITPFGGDLSSSPLGVNLANASILYSEGDTPVPIDATLTLDGGMAEDITGATISITAGFAADEDQLAFTNQLGITGSYDAATGILTLSGNASIGDYQTALRTVTYSNSSEAPSTATREITITIRRGEETAAGSRSVNVTSVNDAPNVSFSITTVTADEDDLPRVLDDAAMLEDVDDDQLTSVTVVIGTGYRQGEDQLTITGQSAAIDADFDVATGTLTLSGLASVDDYQDALRLVTYSNSSVTPTVGAREIVVTADDGDDSGSATLNLMLGSNVAPPEVTNSSGSLTYTEGDGSVPVDDQLTVADADSDMLVSATVQITAGYVEGEDVLDFVDQASITGTFDATTGTLTLSGMSTVADYQAALRTVTYMNGSEDPSDMTRQITITVSDGVNSGEGSRMISVVPVNDPLSLIVPPSVPASGNLTVELGGDPLSLDFGAEDVDDSAFVFQLDLEASGIDPSATQPVIDASSGVLTWQPSSAGVFAVRVLVVNESGQADQQVIMIEVTDLSSNL